MGGKWEQHPFKPCSALEFLISFAPGHPFDSYMSSPTNVGKWSILTEVARKCSFNSKQPSTSPQDDPELEGWHPGALENAATDEFARLERCNGPYADIRSMWPETGVNAAVGTSVAGAERWVELEIHRRNATG